MKVAVFRGLRQLEVIDAPEPVMSRPDDVLLQIDRVGVCGSDIHYYLNGRIGDQVLQYPATLGHECSGTVLAVGPDVRNVAPGDRVAIDPAITCGTCDQCRLGRFHTCRHVRFMGSPGQAPGAAAERVVVPARCCFAVPANVTLDQAALVEPLSVGLHAVRVAQLGNNAKIAILGAGPIGLSVLLCAKAQGNYSITVADLREERLKFAQLCGANGTVIVKHEGREVHEDKYEFVFECTGDPTCIDQGQRLLKCGGTLVIVGIPGVDQAIFDPHFMRRHELTFKSVRRQNQCVEPLIEMLAQGKINADPLITHRYSLENIAQAFETVAGYREGVVKAMIEVSEVYA